MGGFYAGRSAGWLAGGGGGRPAAWLKEDGAGYQTRTSRGLRPGIFEDGIWLSTATGTRAFRAYLRSDGEIQGFWLRQNDGEVVVVMGGVTGERQIQGFWLRQNDGEVVVVMGGVTGERQIQGFWLRQNDGEVVVTMWWNEGRKANTGVLASPE